MKKIQTLKKKINPKQRWYQAKFISAPNKINWANLPDSKNAGLILQKKNLSVKHQK